MMSFEESIAAIKEINSRYNEDKTIDRIVVSKILPADTMVSLENEDEEIELHIPYVNWKLAIAEVKVPTMSPTLFYGIPVTYE